MCGLSFAENGGDSDNKADNSKAARNAKKLKARAGKQDKLRLKNSRLSQVGSLLSCGDGGDNTLDEFSV